MEKDREVSHNWRETLTELIPVGLFALIALWIVVFLFTHFAGEEATLRDVLLVLSGALVAPVGLWLSFRRTKAMDAQNANTKDQIQLQQDTEKNTRLAKAFTDAIGQLGDERAHVRAGAAHALGNIALQDVETYYNTVIDILSGFLRERCTAESRAHDNDDGFPDGYRLPADIEAALTAVSNCNGAELMAFAEHPERRAKIDLSCGDLRCWVGLRLPLSFQHATLDLATLGSGEFVNCNFDYMTLRVTTNAERLLFSDCSMPNAQIHFDACADIYLKHCELRSMHFTMSSGTGFEVSHSNVQDFSALFVSETRVRFRECYVRRTEVAIVPMNENDCNHEFINCFSDDMDPLELVNPIEDLPDITFPKFYTQPEIRYCSTPTETAELLRLHHIPLLNDEVV